MVTLRKLCLLVTTVAFAAVLVAAPSSPAEAHTGRHCEHNTAYAGYWVEGFLAHWDAYVPGTGVVHWHLTAHYANGEFLHLGVHTC